MIEKNNCILKALRITEEMSNELKEASNEMGIGQSDLSRFLLKRALKQLKVDALKAGGYSKLEITIRKD